VLELLELLSPLILVTDDEFVEYDSLPDDSEKLE